MVSDFIQKSERARHADEREKGGVKNVHANPEKGLLLFINSHSLLQKKGKNTLFIFFPFIAERKMQARGEGRGRGKKYIMKSASSVIFLQIKSALMRAGDNSGTLISLTCFAHARKSVTSSHSQDLYLL